MSAAAGPTTSLHAERSPWLRGRMRVAGDPATACFALALAALGRGESVVEQVPAGPATDALVAGLRAFGIPIDLRTGRWHVTGLGTAGLLEPVAPIVLGHTIADPLLVGMAGLLDLTLTLSGPRDARLDRLVDLLRAEGVRVRHGEDQLELRGLRVALPLDVGVEGDDAALAPALLLGAVSILGTHRFTGIAADDPLPTLMRGFGARIEGAPGGLTLAGRSPLRAQALAIPADPAWAALPVLAAMVTPDSEIVVEGLPAGADRTGLFTVFRSMGAAIESAPARRIGGFEVVDLTVRATPLTGLAIGPDTVAPADLPLVAVAAAFAQGETTIATDPHTPEAMRLHRALAAVGVTATLDARGLVVTGGPVHGGVTLRARLDPRLAIGFLIMGMAAERPIGVDDASAVEALFPGFVRSFERVGAGFSSGEGA